jgi:hypothetical protein
VRGHVAGEEKLSGMTIRKPFSDNHPIRPRKHWAKQGDFHDLVPESDNVVRQFQDSKKGIGLPSIESIIDTLGYWVG